MTILKKIKIIKLFSIKNKLNYFIKIVELKFSIIKIIFQKIVNLMMDFSDINSEYEGLLTSSKQSLDTVKIY
jgi:hypothetical protein